jgi:hypothetical protein
VKSERRSAILDDVDHRRTHAAVLQPTRDTSKDARGYVRLKLVDSGAGWLIFALPPSEMGVHPAEGPAFESGVRHLTSFMCDDLNATVTELRAKGVQFEIEPEEEEWGIHITTNLPGDCKVLLYEPRYAMAISAARAPHTE